MKKSKARWFGDQRVLDNSVVGTIMEDSFGRGWWAYGCLEDWEDTKLGLHPSRRKAERAVEEWVRDNS